MTTIAVIGMGDMGAGVAGRLARGGATVLTTLQGRSPASIERAKSAGIADASVEEIGRADYLLSIVPPAEAHDVAQRWSAALAQAARRPVYIDCNATSVETTAEIEATVRAAGMRYIDGSIIGAPGKPEAPGPALYLSGERAEDVEALAAHGLRARSTGGPVGAASALKMAYAGINKGFTALAAAMVLAATRAGAADALRTELAESVPRVLEHMGRTLPDMYPKAWRWDFEMRQVAQFAQPDEDLAKLYEGMAGFYATLGRDWQGPREAAAALDAFLGRPSERA
jgi:3-hydroxyisobutyrate dehydrogenase-like beta-hydroxyacid dehydrogenase